MLKKIARTMAYIGSIITGFYLFTSAPGFHKREKWQHLTGWDYAHRGLHDNEHGIPENSMAAFQRAVDKGYGIELDVHLTADNQLVVFHDDTLTRMCGINKKIRICSSSAFWGRGKAFLFLKTCWHWWMAKYRWLLNWRWMAAIRIFSVPLYGSCYPDTKAATVSNLFIHLFCSGLNAISHRWSEDSFPATSSRKTRTVISFYF